MSNLQPATPQITISNNIMQTTSRNIAEVFGKQHLHVLRDIEALEVPQEFKESNFGLCSYKGKNGQSYKMHNITRDGFTLLAMGFNGKKAMVWKLSYIEAFNLMEAELLKKYQQAALPQTITPKQKLAIREAIAEKVYAHYPEGKRQLGFSVEYKAFYKAFDISTYSELPENRYGDATLFILGDYVPPAETLTVDDDHIAFSKCNHDAATQLIALLQAQHEAFTSMQAKVNGLAEELGTVTKELQAFKTATNDIVKDLAFTLH